MILLQCNEPTLLPILSILKTVFLMIQIIAPILAIISLMILMFKLMISPQDPMDPRKDNTKLKHKIKNAIIALVIVFLIPTFIDLTMLVMGENFTVSSCWKVADNYKMSSGSYNNSRNKKRTSIINQKSYDKGYEGTGMADSSQIFVACEEQAKWMKNYTYSWENNPTIEKSKYKGTCVTYVACVLQRIGALKPGKAIWHTGSGYGTGRVYGATSSMDVIYMNNKSFVSLKSQLQAGDIMMVDDNRSGNAGNGGHVFIFTGKWDSNNNPIIYDNGSAERVKSGRSAQHTYGKNRKVLAVVRLKS